jgi:hypothetical protein
VFAFSFLLCLCLRPANGQAVLSTSILSNNIWRGIPSGYGTSLQGELSFRHHYESFDKYHREGELLVGTWGSNRTNPSFGGTEIDIFSAWSPRLSYNFWGELGGAHYLFLNGKDEDFSEAFVGVKFSEIEETGRYRLSARFSTDLNGSEYLESRFLLGIIRGHIGKWIAGRDKGSIDYSVGVAIWLFGLDYTTSNRRDGLKEHWTLSLNIGDSRWKH